jgi:hypothetical protein
MNTYGAGTLIVKKIRRNGWKETTPQMACSEQGGGMTQHKFPIMTTLLLCLLWMPAWSWAEEAAPTLALESTN